MKKIITATLVMFGITFAIHAQSPILELGKAVGELVVLPFGIVAGACEGIYEGVEYIVTGETSTTTTTIKTTTVTQPSTPPVYVVPSQPKTPTKNEVNIVNSPGASVTINEVNSTTQTPRTPTVIYVPSIQKSYYYYQPNYRYCYP